MPATSVTSALRGQLLPESPARLQGCPGSESPLVGSAVSSLGLEERRAEPWSPLPEGEPQPLGAVSRGRSRRPRELCPLSTKEAEAWAVARVRGKSAEFQARQCRAREAAGQDVWGTATTVSKKQGTGSGALSLGTLGTDHGWGGVSWVPAEGEHLTQRHRAQTKPERAIL